MFKHESKPIENDDIYKTGLFPVKDKLDKQNP